MGVLSSADVYFWVGFSSPFLCPLPNGELMKTAIISALMMITGMSLGYAHSGSGKELFGIGVYLVAFCAIGGYFLQKDRS